MKRANRPEAGITAIEHIEQATHLLRAAPAATLAAYYVGAIPFTLGLLYFWADMSLSPFAHRHRAEAALGMAGLFLWMKFCQTLFARRLRAQLAGDPMPRWTLRQYIRVFVGQAIVQPAGLVLIPLSLVPVLPFGWVYAFYQNCTALADPQPLPSPSLARRAYKQAALWPAQNHLILGVMLIFAFVVFLNCTIVSLWTPHLAKMLFGVESVFTRSPWAMLNTTFLTAMAALTYLFLDPLMKAIYALRCFHGESLQSGEDLKAQLRRHAAQAQPLVTSLIVLVALLSGARVSAAEASAEPSSRTFPSSAISPAELDRSIDQVIQDRKYTWRMPRERIATDAAEGGVISQFFEKTGELLRKWGRAILNWLGDLLKKLFRPRSIGSGDGGAGYGWILSLQLLLYALVAAAVIALLFLLYRLWRGRPDKTAVASEPVLQLPNVADEHVGPEQLPVEGWARLARELLERGEYRLALRAFYLASLAHLADRNLISIARFKSNRDYQRELQRRAHAFPQLGAVFGDNVTVFERIWYGMHEVDRDLVAQFALNVENMRTAGGAP